MAVSNAIESDVQTSDVVVEMTKMDYGRAQAVESEEEQPLIKQRTKFRLYMIVVAEFVNIHIASSLLFS